MFNEQVKKSHITKYIITFCLFISVISLMFLLSWFITNNDVNQQAVAETLPSNEVIIEDKTINNSKLKLGEPNYIGGLGANENGKMIDIVDGHSDMISFRIKATQGECEIVTCTCEYGKHSNVIYNSKGDSKKVHNGIRLNVLDDKDNKVVPYAIVWRNVDVNEKENIFADIYISQDDYDYIKENISAGDNSNTDELVLHSMNNSFSILNEPEQWLKL